MWGGMGAKGEIEMLIFSLKKQWYEKILRGEKTIEYREVKPYWNKRLNTEFNSYSLPLPKTGVAWRYEDWPQPHAAILRLGYTKRHMTAQITKLEVVDGKYTDLAIDKPVYAIHLADIREAGNEQDVR